MPKISQLPTVVSAQSTDIFPIVRSGADYQVAISQLGNAIVAGSAGQLQYNNAGVLAGATITYSAGNLTFSPDVTAPQAQVLQMPSVLAGNTNTAGANLTITASRGTGSSPGGAIIFQSAKAGTSGSSQNPLTPQVTISSGGGLIIAAPQSGQPPLIMTAFPTGANRLMTMTSSTNGAAAHLSVNISSPNTTDCPYWQWNLGSNITGVIATIGTGGALYSGTLAGDFMVIAGQSTGRLCLGANASINMTIGAAGNVSTVAPTSGVSLTVNGLAGQNSIVASGAIQTGSFAVAGLPSAATVGAGSRAFVTDANATMTAGIGTTVVGGGANKVPVYSDGANWLIG